MPIFCPKQAGILLASPSHELVISLLLHFYLFFLDALLLVYYSTMLTKHYFTYKFFINGDRQVHVNRSKWMHEYRESVIPIYLRVPICVYCVYVSMGKKITHEFANVERFMCVGR